VVEVAEPEWRDAVPISELERGRPTRVQIGPRILAVGEVDGGYFAVQSECPHAAGDLSEGDLEDNFIICPVHAWDFDVFSGECVRHGAQIASYPVRVESGILQVEF
jgi:nitrite reductase/ring-hydroxylating ferredoxin subunit